MARAKPDPRSRAVELRLQGWSYREIAAVVAVSKSTLSLWLRDVPLTAAHRASLDDRRARGARSRGDAIRAGRVRRVEVLQAAAATEIGSLSDRELFLVGVTAYWCEGTKAKPWRPSVQLQFVNSDPTLVRLFLRWLRLLGIDADQCAFTVSIHERADIGAAVAWWAAEVGVPASSFRRPNVKRHNPRTVRSNVGEGYVGCLTITVRRSTKLNRRVAGWWAGIAAGAERPVGTIEGAFRDGVAVALGPLEP